MIKNYLIILIVFIFVLFPCFSYNQVHITGGVCVDITGITEINDVTSKITDDENNQFWGIGWEVIMDKLGIGGNYYSNFIQDEFREWSINWYSEVFFLGYHFFGAGVFLDPFCQVGLGSCGGVYLGKVHPDSDTKNERLKLSLFPFLSAGLVLNFEGFLIGAKLNYTPQIMPIPITNIEMFDLKDTQFLLFFGIGLGENIG